MSATHIGALLERAAEKTGAGTEIQAARVLQAANEEIGRLFGREGRRYLRATAYARGVLVCESRSSSASAALRQNEEALLRELQKRFSRVRIDRIQVRGAREA